MPDALFESRGDNRFEPTEIARGPWSPELLHGGTVSALLAGHAEAVGEAAAPVPMQAARWTLELLRPLAFGPMTRRAEVVRAGRKVQWVAAELVADDDTRLAAATLLRMRTDSITVPEQPPPATPPSPERGAPMLVPPGIPDVPAFHNQGVEHRFVAGQFNVTGPATDWIRLRVPVVQGDEVTPLVRVAAAADFGNGVSAPAYFGELIFVNADLTVHLHRLPVGEWVCLDSVTRLGDRGIGMAESALYDEAGPIGRSVQSLLLER